MRLRNSARNCWYLLGFLASLVSWLLGVSPAFAGPSPAPASGASRVPASGASAPSPFLNVSRLGESAAQAALREGHLLSHLRGIDPFGITIRGPYKGLPPVAEHPAEQPTSADQAAAAAKVPTLEKAVQALQIGGVNARESRNPGRIAIDPRRRLAGVGIRRQPIRRLGAERRGARRVVLRHRFAKAYSETGWIRSKRVTGCSCPKRITGRSRLWNIGY